MKIYVRQLTGTTISINVDINIFVADLYRLLYKKHRKIKISNYLRAVELFCGNNTLDISKTLKDYKIRKGATVIESLKLWTTGFGIDFNRDKLTGTCPITLNKLYDPIIITPGCFHCFERSALFEWMKYSPECPLCRKDINETLLNNLE